MTPATTLAAISAGASVPAARLAPPAPLRNLDASDANSPDQKAFSAPMKMSSGSMQRLSRWQSAPPLSLEQVAPPLSAGD